MGARRLEGGLRQLQTIHHAIGVGQLDGGAGLKILHLAGAEAVGAETAGDLDRQLGQLDHQARIGRRRTAQARSSRAS